jgi:AraC-like DNA-binding protein
MKITLTPQQKQQLEQMHDSTRDSRVCDRIKAVLLASEGWSQTMISQALRIHESTVARHLISADVHRSRCLSLGFGGALGRVMLSKGFERMNFIFLHQLMHCPIAARYSLVL